MACQERVKVAAFKRSPDNKEMLQQMESARIDLYAAGAQFPDDTWAIVKSTASMLGVKGGWFIIALVDHSFCIYDRMEKGSMIHMCRNFYLGSQVIAGIFRDAHQKALAVLQVGLFNQIMPNIPGLEKIYQLSRETDDIE